MDWNDLSFKVILIVIAVTATVAGSGKWWLGVVVAVPMVLIFLAAAMIQRRSARRNLRQS